MATDHNHPVDQVRVAAAKARLIDTEEAGRLAGLLGLLADPTRARILYALDLVDELCVGDLALALEATEDSVGYALRVLAGQHPKGRPDRLLPALERLPRTAARPLPAGPGRAVTHCRRHRRLTPSALTEERP